MTHHAKTHLTASLLALAGLLIFSAPASASKQVVAFFPSDVGDIAVNSSGAGPADAGDIYVLGANGNAQIERFATDDNGTPADPYDDSYPFVAAWGAGVLTGGTNYEICTVQADCLNGVGSGGNGTPAGNGALKLPIGNSSVGLAVDQDTGHVYASDHGQNRVNVYSGDGTFLRSFGYGVIESGPNDNGTGYEVCVAADGDVCKAGVSGAGVGQIGYGAGIAVSAPDGNPATGTVFLADAGNRRVNTYALDGSSPSSFGSAVNFANSNPEYVAVDSRGVVYATDGSNSGEIERYDSQNANGGGVGFLAPIPAPPLLGSQRKGLEVDPDSDGGGSDKDILYVVRDIGHLQQFGPLNEPGLSAPPAAQDDQHGQTIGFSFITGFGFDYSTGRLFAATRFTPEFGVDENGTYVLDTAGGPPTASLDSISDITATTVTAHATIDPNGPPPVSYQFEYSTDGSNWTALPSTIIGSQQDPQAVDAVLDSRGAGLDPDTFYHARLQVTKVFNPPVATNELTFTTLPAPPRVETTGAPLRTATTAQLTGRVNPRGDATEYHFEYGSQGPCSANPCASTPDRPAGSGQLIQLVAEEIDGLQPDTTYHYRLLADNGNPGSPVAGEEMTVTTRASDAPLSHGDFPGPSGSDRAWELVSAPDTSGNPVYASYGFSPAGDRAAYQVAGGTPDSVTGAFDSVYYAERPAGEHPQSGWQTTSLEPPRSELIGGNWGSLTGLATTDDLSAAFAWNGGIGTAGFRLFRLEPDGTFAMLHAQRGGDGFFATAGDGSTVAVELADSFHPAHLPGTGRQLYELSSGTPSLISFLPDGSVGPCNASVPTPHPHPHHTSRAVSADGSLVFFYCGGGPQLYVRDLDAGVTRFVGPGAFIKSTPDAAFFAITESLDPADTGGRDVYRYQLADGARSCVTCVVPGLDAEVDISTGGGAAADNQIAVADDGSRVYFRSPNRLVPGAAPNGIYRVKVATGELAYLADTGDGNVGDDALYTEAISADGSLIVFGSDAPSLNPLGGQDNGGTLQYYLYDDTDRSLTCVSCPTDGSPPLAGVVPVIGASPLGPNTSPLADDGTFAFATKTPLHPADQNTPGPGEDLERGKDAYEYRDGRLLLVTDGFSSWPSAGPIVHGISPSGRDVFFLASARYTADALDDNFRLYDARLGGGIDFPVPPPPCPLEVCQGTPKGAPDDPFPGSTNFIGRGNVPSPSVKPKPRRCAKGKRKVRRAGKVRCVAKKHKRANKHRRANRDRRAHR